MTRLSQLSRSVASKVVVVTGAASGMGRATAHLFADEGARVAVVDLGAERVLAVVDEIRAAHGSDVVEGYVVDVADLAALHRLVDDVVARFGGLDVLVNNAGVAGGGRVDRCTLEEWQWITDINLFGLVRGTKAFVPMLKEQRSGHLVNVASLAGLVHPGGMGSYNAVKAAVVAFTETCGHELASYGIRASVVCPSYFRTNLMDSMQGSDEAIGRVVAGLVERSRVTADDIAAAVLAGMDAGDDVIVPDEAARQAYFLKWADRAAYDAVMRDQAAKLEAMS